FPQLKPYLEDVCEMLPAGKKFLINRYRSTNANLRTQRQPADPTAANPSQGQRAAVGEAVSEHAGQPSHRTGR
ncbi:hypothetical protein ACEN2Q_25610, partial [Bremerella cremea]|uniref:hypothetical protein n=1 Tax=Bremerella cremea TaxID=1031537 RepID=UPI00358DD7D1